MGRVVLDASVTIAAILPGEPQEPLRALLFGADRGDLTLVSAPLWLLEAGTGLLRAARRGRIAPDDLRLAWQTLRLLPILAVELPAEDEVFELAEEEQLSMYDAAYLCLALQLSAPLATLDQRLAEAAARRSVLWAQPAPSAPA